MEKEIVINGTTYVPKGSEKTLQLAKTNKNMKYVLVRGDRSGVFTGYLKSKKGKEVTLLQARRIWYWSGANSISELATHGTTKPTECRFPCEVCELEISDCIELIPCTEKARLSIAGVKIWAQ